MAHLGHMQHGMLLQHGRNAGPQLASNKGRGASKSPPGACGQLGRRHCQCQLHPALIPQQRLQGHAHCHKVCPTTGTLLHYAGAAHQQLLDTLVSFDHARSDIFNAQSTSQRLLQGLAHTHYTLPTQTDPSCSCGDLHLHGVTCPRRPWSPQGLPCTINKLLMHNITQGACMCCSYMKHAQSKKVKAMDWAPKNPPP